MRTDAVNLRSKNNDLCDERSSLKRKLETAGAKVQTALEERYASIANIRSLWERRNQELDSLEHSATTTQEKRTRLQLHSTEMTVSIVSLRRKLEESRAAMAAARVSEEAGRQQLTRMMDEQLAQNQTIEALRRQVETSNITARDAQALLRTAAAGIKNATTDQLSDWDWWCHRQHSLCAIPFNSIDWAAHKRAPWTGLLPCGITSGPRVCRADARHVWS